MIQGFTLHAMVKGLYATPNPANPTRVQKIATTPIALLRFLSSLLSESRYLRVTNHDREITMKSKASTSRTRLFFALLLFAAVAFSNSNTATAKSEEAIQAALILQLAKFVDWPRGDFQSASSPIVVGVMGDERLREILTFMAIDKKVGKRGIRVVDAKASSSWSSVQILFIDESKSSDISKVLRSVNAKSVLTVSEAEGFPEQGGMVYFDRVSKKIHLTINTAATSAARLNLDSKLLSIATITSH
jgi:hypothetical protein